MDAKLELQMKKTTNLKLAVGVGGSQHQPKIDSVAESDIVRTIRDNCLASFKLEIDSYKDFRQAVLNTSGAKCYKSDIFEAGGEQWSLSLYPDGDKERKGKGYISLYLIIEGLDAKPTGWSVYAEYKFFVHDRNQDKYLTIQDASRELKRFYAMKKEWGFAQLLSHNDFSNVNNGYLVEDKCVFGVQILVHDCKVKTERLPALEILKKPNNTYTWRVQNFSTKNEDVYYSDIFRLGPYQWKLRLNPKGNPTQKGKYLSLFLILDDAKLQPPSGLKVLTEFKLCLKNQKDGKDWEGKCLAILSASCSAWGYSDSISIKDLRKGLLVDDTLIIQVHMIRMSTVKLSPENA